MGFIAGLLVLEMLCINTYATYSCSSRKWPSLRTVVSVIAVTAVITALVGWFYLESATLGAETANGKGLFMLLGFLYVIPLKYLFKQSIKQTMIIMSSAWVYTMFVFAVSVQIAYLIPTSPILLSAVTAQSVIYVLTLPSYIKFVNRVFIYIFRNIEKSMLDPLLAVSLSWFFIIFLLNYAFVEGATPLLKFLVLLLIIVNVYISYKMLFKLVYVHNKAETLTTITKTDALTQLKNREGLNEDVQHKIDTNTPFALIFIDLDDFKAVNDSYGHAAGDAYLIEFSKKATANLRMNDSLYRLHGDEFIILTDMHVTEGLCGNLAELHFVVEPGDIEFKGMSSGHSSFPADGNKLSELLYLADLRMYQAKKQQHRLLDVGQV